MGKAALTKEWRQAGLARMEPIEVFLDPHLRQGYAEACDLTLPHVVKDMIYSAKRGKANVRWLSPPCTSFCNRSLENGRTRTFECPEEGANGVPLKDVEHLGNSLGRLPGRFGGQRLSHRGEHGSQWKVPKMWDLPWWKAILARPDVEFVEFPTRALGLGPPEGDGFYHPCGLSEVHNFGCCFVAQVPRRRAHTSIWL